MITPATRITTTPWKVIPQSDQGAVTCVVGLTIDPKTITVNSGRDVCSNRVKIPVSAGEVVTTARVVIAVPATPPPGSRAREIDMRGAWTMGREPDAETPVKEKQP